MEAITERDNRHVVTFGRSFCFLFLTTIVTAFLLFFAVDFANGAAPNNAPVVVSNGFHRYSLWEIAANPYPYLLSISFFFSFLGAFWVTKVAPRYKNYSYLQIFVIPWLALIVTSPVWGLIWSINRWPPQGFSSSDVMMLFYKHDVMVGLTLGWLSGLLSFPINIISYVAVCGLLVINKKLFFYSK